MKILMYILFVFGVCEIISNLFFLINRIKGHGYAQAKKFHGDFPPYASDQAWLSKILVMLSMGTLAFITAYCVYKDYNIKVNLLYIFSGGMVIVGIFQALAYGRKHFPAVGSLIIGLIFLALTFFLH
jgi:hypothetical protein